MRRKNGPFGCILPGNCAGSKATKNVRSIEGALFVRNAGFSVNQPPRQFMIA
jgi:hypothetical protein